MIQRVADCRYLGQGYELRVEAGSGPIDAAWACKLVGDFHDAHEREYSRRFEESDIEIPNIRVRGIGLMPPLSMPEVAQQRGISTSACTTRATLGSASTASCASCPRVSTTARAAAGHRSRARP